MSAIAALVACGDVRARALDRMLGAAVDPYDAGDAPPRAHVLDGVALGARATAWERALAGAPLATVHGIALVADATLYHRGDLRRALRAHLDIAADADDATLLCTAVAAFGDRAGEHLEGDVALVAWDAARGALVAVRDFMGRRPLYFARWPDGLAIASHPRMLAAHDGVDARIDALHVAGRAAGLLEAPDTAHAGIEELRPGHTLVARVAADGSLLDVTVRRHWTPPTFESHDGRAGDEAAERLRDLLQRATAERLAARGATAVWLSGGHDSPAVFASGMAVVGADDRHRGDARVLRAVSMRYPAGDPGREDERIEAVAARWGAPITWQDVDEVPLFGDDAAVRRRAGPFAHAFECWMRALTARARDVGARVVLDGSGGDQLFQVSPVYVADLVRAGRWVQARRELRALGLTTAGWRRVARTAVLPLLPRAAWPVLARMRGGRPLRGLRAGVVPPWIRAPWRDRLVDRLEVPMARRPGESCAALESRWYFETSYAGAVFAEQTAIVRGAGGEPRSPLYDGRIVAFAATRPRHERARLGETKCLLRGAMRATLPAVVLAARTGRAGTTDAYFRRRMVRELPGIVSRVLHDPALADLGVLDPAIFAAAVERYLRANDEASGAAIFATVQAERWLRARG